MCWVVASGVLWIIGGLLDGKARYSDKALEWGED